MTIISYCISSRNGSDDLYFLLIFIGSEYLKMISCARLPHFIWNFASAIFPGFPICFFLTPNRREIHEQNPKMGTQDTGRKRLPNRERLTAEDDALNLIAREVSESVTPTGGACSSGRVSELFRCSFGELKRWSVTIIRSNTFSGYVGVNGEEGGHQQPVSGSEAAWTPRRPLRSRLAFIKTQWYTL